MSIAYAQKNKNAVQTKRESSVSIIDTSSQSESLQRKADMANNAAQRAEAPRPNNTGMPDNLKSGIESLSGFSMDDVRVHYNSSKPAKELIFMSHPVKKNTSRTKHGMSLNKWLAVFLPPRISTACL